MLASVLVSVAMLGQATAGPARYDAGERLKFLDRAWLANLVRERRLAAAPKASRAVSALFAGNYVEASRALDEATATLEGRDSKPEDAITVLFDPPYIEPKTMAYLRIRWAYQPSVSRTVRVSVGNQSVIATPGRTLTMAVRPERLNPELINSPEAGYLVPVRVGSNQRAAYISIIKRPRTRVRNLLAAKTPEAREIAGSLDRLMSNTKAMEADVPVIQQLFTAELLEEGRLKLDRAENLPLVRQGNTIFRVAFPKSQLGTVESRPGATVVVAVPGAGGTENSFFEGYGRGLAVSEALKRGWVFVSPRSGPTGAADCLDWLKNRRGLKIARVLVIGHGSGAELALQAAGVSPKPAGIALFAPSVQALPSDLGSIPVYVAAGRQDGIFLSMARRLEAAVQGRPRSEYQEIDASEYLTIVPEALPAAYRFFEGL
jgi:hypothetical protein